MSRSPQSLAVWVAARYLKSTRRDAFITFLTLTAAAGIALGVATLILAIAALAGFQAALRGEILARTPQVEARLPAGADAAAALEAVSSMPGVREAQLAARGRGWLLARGRVRAVELFGFGAELPRQFPEASGRRPGLYVSDRLAAVWGLEAGDALEIASTRPTLSPFGPLPRVRRLPLAGTFAAGRAEQAERVALPLAEAALLLDPDEVRLLVAGADLDAALGLAPGIAERLPAGSQVRTWRDLNRPLFFALRLEKSLMFVAVFLIVVVAALSLVSDLNLILASKRPEMGMLGAMGATPADLRRVFLWLGGLLVAAGVVAGAAGGIAGALVLDRFRVLSLPSQVYFLDHVPFLVRWPDVAAILLATVGLTLGCCLLAARRAAALRPVEALRR